MPAGRTTRPRRSFEPKGETAFPPTPFPSANAVGMLKTKADELGVTKISDLQGKSQDLTLVRLARVPPADRLPGRAGEDLRPPVQVVQPRRHRPALHGARQGPGGRVDRVHIGRPAVGEPGQVRPARGRQGRSSRPATSSSSPTSRRSQKAGPDYQATIEKVQKGLTLTVMQELNARVDIDKQEPGGRRDGVPEGGRLHPVVRSATSGIAKGPGLMPPALSSILPRQARAKSPRSTGGNGGPKGVHTPRGESQPTGS